MRNDYEKLLSAYDFKQQNSDPTRETAVSSTFLDHLITSCHVQAEKILRAISDHFTVLGGILLSANEWKHQASFLKRRDCREIEGDKALKFLFLLEKEKTPNFTSDTSQVDKIAKSKNECIDQFAWEILLAFEQIETQWITNKVKIAVTKRDHFFHEWGTNPTDFNQDAYRKLCRQVISTIKNAKRKPIAKNCNQPIN